MNTKVFRKLRFDPKTDVPKGYKLARKILIQAKVQNSYRDVCSQDLTRVHTYVSFEAHKAKNWRLHFGANPGG